MNHIIVSIYELQAGIPSHRLEISLEPEAASIYCKYIPVSKRENDEESGNEPGIEAISTGTKYLVLDAGGITKPKTYFYYLYQ